MGSHRRWATASLAAGGLWVVFSVLLPTPLTTLMGVPFGVVALVAGWIAWRGSRQAGDQPGGRRAAWGLGLGCAGCLWQVLYYGFLGGLALGGLSAFLQSLNRTPTP